MVSILINQIYNVKLTTLNRMREASNTREHGITSKLETNGNELKCTYRTQILYQVAINTKEFENYKKISWGVLMKRKGIYLKKNMYMHIFRNHLIRDTIFE